MPAAPLNGMCRLPLGIRPYSLRCELVGRMLRCMSMRASRRTGAVLLLVLTLLVVTGGYLHYRDRTVVLGEQRGDRALVAARSLAVRSAEVTSDGWHVRVAYLGSDVASGGCGVLSSVRVTKHRDVVSVRVQEGVPPTHRGVCTLGGKAETLLIPLRQRLPLGTRVHQVL